MREIKFRVWDKAFNKMRGVNGIKDCFSIRSDGEFYGNFELMQYTGLKDKNGVDIYEGDVVIPFTDQKTKAQIIFMSGSFKIATKTHEGNYHIWNYFESEIKVIGNTYENPELINN